MKNNYKKNDVESKDLTSFFFIQKLLKIRRLAIDTIAVENEVGTVNRSFIVPYHEVADNMYQRSELDYLIYNNPVAYSDLILNGNPEAYLKAVTEYKPRD